MAVTNPQAVKFANEVVRPVADRYSQLYWRAKAFLQEWTANNYAAQFPNDATAIADGADTDGRGVITGAMVNGLKANLQTFVNDLEANANAKLNGLSQISVKDID